MLTLLFMFIMLGVFGKLIAFSIRAAWGIAKIILFVVFLPMVIAGLFFGGTLTLALPILAVVAVAVLVTSIAA